MRSTIIIVGIALALGVALAEETKLPDETKTFARSQRARLASVQGGYAWKHANEVTLVAFANDGRSVLAGDDKALVSWERASGREEKVLRAPGSISVSGDGKRLAVAGDELVVVDTSTQKKVWSVDGRVKTARFSQDGKRLVAASGTTATVYDAEKGKEVRTLRADAAIDWALLSPDGKRALVGDQKRLVLFDVQHAKRLGAIESDSPITCVAWSDALLVTGAQDGKVKAWDVESLKTRWDRLQKKAVLSVALAGDLVATSSDEGAIVVRDSKGTERFAFEEHARAIALSPDGRTLASAEHMVRLWSLENGKRIAAPDAGHEGPIVGLSVSFDELHLLSASTDHSARVWNISAPRALRVLDHGAASLTAVAFSPDAKEALTATDDGSLELWDMKEGADLHRFTNVGPVGALGFGPNVLRAATLEGQLVFFERASRKKSLELGSKAAKAPVAIAGKLALLGSEKGTIKVWDVETGREVRTLDGRLPIRAIACSVSGKRALVGGQGSLRLFDVQSGTELRALDMGPLTVTALAVSADDKLGLSATEEGKLGIWDLESGKLVDVIDLAGARDHGRSLAFTKDGFVVGTGRGVLLRFEWLGA